MPDISGLDLAQGLADDNSVGGDAASAGVISHDPEVSLQNIPVLASDNPTSEIRGEGAEPVAMAPANQVTGPVEGAARDLQDSAVLSLLQKAEEEKAAIQNVCKLVVYGTCRFV